MPSEFLIDSILAKRGSLEVELTDGSVCTVLDHDGLGASPVNNITERAPLQHGEQFIDLRLAPRAIALTLAVPATDPEDLQNRTAILTKLFKPGRSITQLIFSLNNGQQRAVDVRYTSGLNYSFGDLVNYYQKLPIRLTAYDSYFYDPVSTPVVFGVGGSAAGFSVPLPVPFSVGTTVLSSTRTVEYPGTWRDYPIILIKGPITNPKIENLSTGEKLDFTGNTVLTGETLNIDLRPGYKTVVDHNGVNRVPWLSADSSLSTFHLGEDDDVADGNNDIKASGTAINSNSEIYITYNSKYISLF